MSMKTENRLKALEELTKAQQTEIDSLKKKLKKLEKKPKNAQ